MDWKILRKIASLYTGACDPGDGIHLSEHDGEGLQASAKTGCGTQRPCRCLIQHASHSGPDARATGTERFRGRSSLTSSERGNNGDRS